MRSVLAALYVSTSDGDGLGGRPHQLTNETVVGHEGKLVFGMMGATSQRVPVVLLVGRVQYVTKTVELTGACKRTRS